MRIHRQELEYTKWLGDRSRKRLRFRREGKQITEFMVQLEVDAGAGQWMPVVRYDTAHGVPHCDIMYLDGHEEDEEIASEFDIEFGYRATLSTCNEDIETNWELYQKRFLEGERPR